MEELKHFSQEHLLILVKGERDEIVRKSICYGCQTPILAEPTYSCGKCSFFLHKRCAEFPKDISHAMHPQHRLILLDKPPYSYSGGTCFCNGCQQTCRNFTYHCNTCAFDLDIICVTIEDRKLKHPSHVHALTFKNQRATFRCHARGNIKEDMSYSCTSCPYWIHESCASSPATKKRKDHDHPLSLAYCLSDDHIGYGFSCDICNRNIMAYHWNCYCGPCRHFVHLQCINTKKKESKCFSKERDCLELPTDNFAGDLLNLIQLPPVTFNPLIWNPKKMFRLDLLNTDRYRPGAIRISNSEIRIDEHSMVCFDLQGDTGKMKSDQEIACEACTKPIFSECYKRKDSNYFLHVTCALTSRTLFQESAIRFPCLSHKHNLRLPASTRSFFKCEGCHLDCNGYLFDCDGCNVRLDVNCAILPVTIAHAAHRHALSRGSTFRGKHTCNGCGDSVRGPLQLSCEPCNFFLGYDCALSTQNCQA